MIQYKLNECAVQASKQNYSCTSPGIWTSSFALGNFIGPSVGGFLFGYLGFPLTTLCFQAVGFALLVVDAGKLCRLRRRSAPTVRVIRENKIDLYERL